MYIRLASGKPFAFAGLWDNWQSPDGSNILSCTIITTQPNELMQSIHNRMPVILPPAAYAQWLQPGEADTAALLPLLAPYPADEMLAYPVSTLVNAPNDLADCVAGAGRLETALERRYGTAPALTACFPPGAERCGVCWQRPCGPLIRPRPCTAICSARANGWSSVHSAITCPISAAFCSSGQAKPAHVPGRRRVIIICPGHHHRQSPPSLSQH
jgi:hypothetical protein